MKDFMNQKPISEAQIQTGILHYLRKYFPSAIVWKIHEDSVFGVIGVPDILFIHKGKVFFFEVKRAGQGASKIQAVVLQKLQNNDVVAEVVYSLMQVKLILLREGVNIKL